MTPIDARVAALRERLDGRELIWMGIRGEDGEPLRQLPELGASFSIIAPLRSATIPTSLNVVFEQLSGVRPDLDRADLDIETGSAAAEFRHRLLQAVNRRCVLMTYRPNRLASALAYAMADTLTLAGMNEERHAAFEHKPWVERSLEARGVRGLGWRYVADEHRARVARMVEREGPHVLRASRTSGGVGIARVDKAADVDRWWPAQPETFVAAAPFLHPTTPINLSGVVFADGSVRLHPVSLQLIGVPSCTDRRFGYCGNDFGAAAALGPDVVAQLEALARRVGAWLAEERYLGVFGIDALVHDGMVHFTEINPRFQGSSAMSAEIAQEADLCDLHLDHLAAMLGLPPAAEDPTLADWVALQPAAAQVVVHSTTVGLVARDDRRPIPDLAPGQRLGTFARNVRVEHGATLCRTRIPRAVTTDGFTIDAECDTFALEVQRSFMPVGAVGGTFSVLTVRGSESDIRRLLATRQPVLVIGPGCQRVGYDDPGSLAWEEVRRRMGLLRLKLDSPDAGYLDRFWRSKLSDEVLEPLAADDPLPLDHQIPKPPGGVHAEVTEPKLVDLVRIEHLALPLLRCLVACTRCLGLVVSQGSTPVVSWHEVVHRPGDGAPQEQRAQAVRELQAFVEFAVGLGDWYHRVQRSEALARIEALGLDRDPGVVAELRNAYQVLRLDEVVARTRWLADNAIGEHNRTVPLSGALVEWFADLLWHLLASDAGVPPSQAELAFYVNLRGEQPRRRYYSRSRPGELRITSGERAAADITSTVKVRLSDGTHGLDDARKWPERWPTDARLRVARTFAAQLWTMWAHGPGKLDPDDQDQPAVADLPVAVVTGYDLTLERQLLDAAAKGSHFHTVVPVWVGSDCRQLRWLCGTYARGQGTVHDTDVAERGRILRWDWFGDGQAAAARVEGPVVVRLNGSPLLRLPEKLTGSTLGCSPAPHSEDPLRLVTVFAELDAVRVVSSFRELRAHSSRFAQRVANAVDWFNRSWAFFGDSLPDWIPRLRLLLNVADRPSTDSNASYERWALDRSFDWPEEGLLEALDVHPYQGDLRALPELSAFTSRTEAEEVPEFFEDLKDLLPWAGAQHERR